MDTSKPSWIVLWGFCVLTYGITLVPNYGFSRAVTIFGYNFTAQKIVEEKYAITLTPANWEFSFWGIVTAWQIAWMVYTGTLIARKSISQPISIEESQEAGHLYYNPPFIDSDMFIAFMASSFFSFLWNVFWSLQLLDWSLLAAIFICISLLPALTVAFKSLRKHGQQLINIGKKNDVICTIVLVHSGLAMFFTWMLISVLLNLTAVVQHWIGVAENVAAAISLAILLVLMTLHFVFDNFLQEKKCRYLFVPYIVVILYLIGCLQQNWNADLNNSIFTTVILILEVIFVIVKIVLVVFRRKEEPLFDWQVSGAPSDENNAPRYTEFSPLIN